MVGAETFYDGSTSVLYISKNYEQLSNELWLSKNLNETVQDFLYDTNVKKKNPVNIAE